MSAGPFREEVERCLADVEALVRRGHEISKLRGREGRRLGTETRQALRELQASLEQLVDEPTELDLAYRELVEGR